MAILGLGTDIIEIARIEKVLLRYGNRLAKRILNQNEWQKYQVHQQPGRFLAKRFAIKEAAVKAFGTGIRSGLAFDQFEVYNDALGKPGLRFFAYAKEMAKKRSIAHVHVTLTDERYYACAIVIIES